MRYLIAILTLFNSLLGYAQKVYGYLFCHMMDRMEYTAFAISRNGADFEDVKHAQPVFDVSKHCKIEGGSRDAYITRMHKKNRFVMVTTDMSVAKSRKWENYGINILWSRNLKSWHSKTYDFRKGDSIFSTNEDRDVYSDYTKICRVWAPQIIWDSNFEWDNKQKGGYMLYYSMLNKEEDKYDKIYYSYLDKKFKHITKPKLLIDFGYATIDADINYCQSDSMYYMLIKKECGQPGIYVCKSRYLNKDYSLPNDTFYIDFEGDKLCEGPSAFKIQGQEGWTIGYVEYTSVPKRYVVCKGNNSFNNFCCPMEIKGVSCPQHGSFLPITKREFNRLKKWK